MRRRELLGGAAVVLAGAAAGCERILAPALPERLTLPTGPTVDPARHLLERAAFGPWPGDVERVAAIGRDAWIDEQLHPDRVDDGACDLRTGFIEAAHLPPSLAFELRPEDIESQLVAHGLLRAVYSRRQLHEVLVSLWTEHFHVAIGKSLCRHLEASYERDVIRRHALGRFRDLVRASVLHPAMLVYLDGRENRAGRGERPNENHARELLELHTLGVGGGYTQRDVMEAARCLSGWIVREEWAPGAVEFVPARHDDGEKVVLGRRIPPGGGRRDVDALVDVLVAHPSCARHVGRKLATLLVADEPAPALVDDTGAVFRRSGGEIAPVVRALLDSDAFAASAGAKVKRPFRFVVSALRALAAETDGRPPLARHLERMGQPPFRHPTPDGYPMEGEASLGTLLWRWAFALDLAEGRIDGTTASLGALDAALARGGGGDRIDRTLRHLLGRAPDPTEELPVRRYAEGARPERVVALALSTPAFQTH